MHIITSKDTNKLFPIFLKLEELNVLVVGGGKVGLEKLNAIINNSPATRITIVAGNILEKIKKLAQKYPNILLREKNFEPTDLNDKDIVIVAINDKTTSSYIRAIAKEKKVLANVADKPGLCDFYLSSVVQKGNLKIAISTNGKSPTMAKRLKETLDDVLPNKLDKILTNMETIRKNMNGNFADKVKKLNKVTKLLAGKNKIKKNK
ncbi:MAG TPA: bifunctional precorrin-2 dehydrogenase/sirohydrochlorin ferrochelatase [Chitinophagaceae bacterium]|nr:bifunctional precorrin-2 dehydrogenase/sirohydrochlorin ferrochelatase [Chitinophagaceae bacterium]